MTEANDKGWAVSVDVGGETVLTIGHNHLSGADNIEDHREVVINCAHHLLSFIGEPEREASLLKALEEAKALIAQYRNDLRYPVAPDSRDRRIERIDKFLADNSSALSIQNDRSDGG